MGGGLRVGGRGGFGGEWISGEVKGEGVPQAEEGEVRERGAEGIPALVSTQWSPRQCPWAGM